MTPDLAQLLRKTLKQNEKHSLYVRRYVPLERNATSRDWRKVTRPNQQFVVIFEQQRPLRGIQFWGIFWLESKVAIQLGRRDLLLGHCGRHFARRARGRQSSSDWRFFFAAGWISGVCRVIAIDSHVHLCWTVDALEEALKMGRGLARSDPKGADCASRQAQGGVAEPRDDDDSRADGTD